MAITHHDFISLADKLSLEADDEVALRCAMSRAYYGAYHAAKRYADTSGWPDYSGSTHAMLALRFETASKELKDKEYLKYSYILTNIHNSRCDADYRINLDLSRQTILKQIAECKRIVQKLSELEQ